MGAQAPDPCTPPLGNAITCENLLAGAPESEWEVSGDGDGSIQGFATDISVNRGQTVSFKIDTNATNYRLDIYRMGYYAGMGARKVATVNPSVSLPQNQPNCLSDSATGLIDCGNWAVSASWAVPANAVSGIYFAKVIRTDTGGASHIVFIVRNDSGNSNLLFQTSDTTWQAYNEYGGNSLYVGAPAGRAYKVSYNRPFTTRGSAPQDWVFNAEYPMVRFLESNGYDVSYFTGVDSDRLGAEIREHRVFLSVGHDEYWSGNQRANVEAARALGVHLAFFSGNEVFWKTRWENSISASGTPYRTLVSYKETHANGKIDPNPAWTGTWRDPRFSPPSDGGRPENALTGTVFTVNSGTTSIQVPSADGKMRFWRGTSVANLAAGAVATLPNGTLGYEWDEDLDNGFRPAGLMRMSDTTVSGVEKLQDHGSTYAVGTANHALTLYRHPSGALVFGAGTVQWTWGLDSNHDRGSAPVSVPMQQATINLFADMGVQPMTVQGGLTTATPSSDVLAPTSTVVSPANGSGVPANSVIIVSGTAADSGGVVGGVEVSVDGGATWRRATGRTNWTIPFQTGAPRTVTIVSRAVDDSGNLEQPVTGVTVEIGASTAVCPCSLWHPTQSPTGTPDVDPQPVELGTRFRSDVNGFVTAIRFYKNPQNTGVHVGSLWSTSGTRLATMQFTGETASGWQEAVLSSPVAIAANTYYIVSYHNTSGSYIGQDGYFAANGVDNGPLHAPRDGLAGANGVYRYGASGFPNETFGSESYWVDVVFVTTIAPDVTPPNVTVVTPTAGTSGVPVTSAVTATFNESMSAASITSGTFQLRDPANALVPAGVTYTAATKLATLQPSAGLAYSTTYTARLISGATGVKDTAGNPLAADYVWTFTTTAPPPPPPTSGPGGPVLVVSSAANRFTEYYAEILRAEGLNAFNVTDITAVTAGTLANYDVAILGEMPLTTAQVTLFSNWVTSGGNLIAMRPDKKLAGLLGLTDAGTTLAEGYIEVNTAAAPGTGIVGDTMQYHGTADRYSLNGATPIATLFTTATTATANPAVTVQSVGAAGGQAAAFTYDLARSIVYTRQGNPAWSGQERDGIAPVRSNDLFFGGASPNYVDLSKVAIPQADEQQRLLANLIGFMNLDRKPLPKFWYFPRGLKAVVVMTGDDHSSNGTAPQFDYYNSVSPANCNVNDWECIRATSYIYPSTPITPAQAAGYTAQGFEIGVHVTTNCANYTPSSLTANYTNDLAQFAATFSGLPAPRTNRTHCIVWSDYTTQADVALANGIRLDTNYYYYPGSWVNDDPGVFTGSGMPMRFARADGTMIDVYQAATQMTDESGQSYPFHSDTLLDRALGPQGFYGAFVTNMHTDNPTHPSAQAIVLSAQLRNVPVISAKQLLDWLDGRNGSTFGNIQWDGSTLTFSVSVNTGANGLRAMLPTNLGVRTLAALARNGVAQPYTVETIKGVAYAIFDAAPGNFSANYAADTSAPIISNITATPATTGATVSWLTNEGATSRVDFGLAPGTLTSSATVSGLMTNHLVALSNLSPSTTYYYTVTSADAAANSSTAPASPASFTTATPPSLNCPCSFWTPAHIPSSPSENDGNAVELGLKFRSSTDGYITAIRFYKGTQNIGVHVGNLWTATGTPLASATFSGETASGWQQVALQTPVAITANTTYIVSYHTNSGFYSADGSYFNNELTSGPLTAPANGPAGGNGVYRYGASDFPTDTFGSTNYWVDVVFNTSLPPDQTPPTVTAVAPQAGAIGVSTATTVTATFSESMNSGSLSSSTFELRDAANAIVPATVSYSPATRTATLLPTVALAVSSTYTARVRGGSGGVSDVAGNPLATDFTWSFLTSGPPPWTGPGGPILVVGAPANPFTRYYAEILRTEGLNAFAVEDLAAITAATLSNYDVVILGEQPLTAAQVTMFSDWVTAGGNLIAMRPDKQLAGLLGLTDVGTTLAEGYLQVNTGAAPGAGIVAETMQYHGTADRYTLNGAASIATLFTTATNGTSNPAVSVRSVGAAGGQAAAFTYDLARSIVYTRQGNPAWSGQERDGIAPIRSDDLFFGGTSPNYVDLTKVAIPQADEQQRLLANLIGFMNLDRKPLPKFWYFPRGLKAVVVMTGDDHAHNGTTPQFEFYKAASPANCSVNDWECIRATSYIYPDTPITPAQAAAYTAEGFEIGVHVTTNCGNYTLPSLTANYTNDLTQFAAAFSGLPSPRTNRTHCIAWSDYTTQADVALEHGIRLDTNYYYWPASWVNDVPGVFTGSGMPMRFARADGTMIDVYQATTQMTDESSQNYPFTASTLLDRALGPQGYYGAFVTNMHTDNPTHPDAQAIVNAAKARGVPVISALQLLNWVDGRNGSSFGNFQWNGTTLTFSVTADARARNLQLLLPAAFDVHLLQSITKDGAPVPFTRQIIKGVDYAVLSAASGSYTANYLVDVTPPVISQVAAAVNNTAATVTWQTSETATSRVEYGTNPNLLGSAVASASAVTAHSIELTNLALGTTYYYRVVSADAVGNVSTSPIATAPPAFFGTPATPTYTCPCSVWTDAQTPAQPSAADPNAIEVGLKFTAAVDGFVTGIRFYKGAQNTGVHTGHLWTGSGTLLGTVTFAGETATGWQVAQLTTPVAVSANTTYVVSYFTNTGFYGADGAYFASAGRTNGPLTALSNAAAGGNGVYIYGGGFPTSTFNSTNYWVDIVFVTSLTPPGSPAASVTDTTASDFSAGTPSGGASVSQSGDGEIILTPSFGEEFTGTALPAGWTTSGWNEGGGATVSSGQLVVDGSLVGTEAQLAPGQRLEFTATFATDPAQHAGFALTFSESRWAMFSTSGGSALYARTHDGTTPIDTLIPGNWAGASHRYRIDWNASSVTFFVDGVQVAAHTTTVTGPLRPVASDFNTGGGTLGIGSVHLAPYAPSGTFASRVLDAGGPVNWANASSIVDAPAGTTLSLSVRFGNTPVPDGTWTAFSAIPTGSTAISGSSRYVQYQVTLGGDGTATPSLSSITFAGPNVQPPPAISVADAEIDEGGSGPTYVPLVLTLSRASSVPVSVAYSTAPISASEGSDYTAVSGTAIFDPGVTMLAVYVVANGDTTIEADETLALNLSAPVNATLADNQAIATLLDDDVPKITIGNASANEGNTGSVNAQFTVTLSRTSTQTITVNYATAAGTATVGSDFTATSGQLSFSPGSTSRTFTVPVLGDTLDEDNETFGVTLSAPVNADILVGSATGTINDNDATPSLSINNVSVAEGNSGITSAVLTVTLSAASGRTVSVNYGSSNGTATEPADYLIASGALSFAPGITTRQITVQVVGDTVQEANETFVVGLSGAVNATITTPQGNGTINNDDSSLSIGNATVTEGNSGSVNAQFTVTLTPVSGVTVTVNYATSNGSALAGTDYTATSGQLSFTAGATTRTITVPVLGDAIDEDNETFIVTLSGAVNANIVTAQGTGTITDNDAPPTLTFANVSVTEGNTGTLNAVFNVTLSAASSRTITVNYQTANGTAVAPDDYTASSGTLTYPAGTTSRQILVPIQGDLADEPSETFTVTLSSPTNATVPTATRTGTIDDNDQPPSISINNVSLTEGNSGNKIFTFTVSLSVASGRTVTVNFATANGTATAGGTTADYASASGSRTFTAGTTTQTIDIQVRGNTIGEPNETFFINLTNPSNATIADAQAVGTILNDD